MNFKLLRLYFSLSGPGRRLLRRLYRMLNDARGMPHYRQLLESIKENIGLDTEKWFASIGSSDRGFSRFIPDWYIRSQGSTGQQLYYRFFKMGAVLLYEHLSLLSAYNIQADSNARQRCVLLAFLKRVYDDLVDKQGLDKGMLFGLQPVKDLEQNADYKLFMELRQTIRRIAPKSEFPNYYGLLDEVNAAQGQEKAAYKIKNGFLLDMYIMINDLPPQVNRALDVTAEFFAFLDDYYDYDEDLAQGKLTTVNQSDDPRRELEKKYAQASEYLGAHSPNPQGYLAGLGNLMRNVFFLRENKLNKLSLFI